MRTLIHDQESLFEASIRTALQPFFKVLRVTHRGGDFTVDLLTGGQILSLRTIAEVDESLASVANRFVSMASSRT